MSDARERIASVVADALHESPSGERIEDVTEQVVADVLAIVRGDMLTEAAKMPEVVEAVRDRIKSIAADPYIKDRYDMYAHKVIEAMLQAAFGADDDGGES